MKFYSTKNKTSSVSFKEALFKGLAPDGGLYMPESIPELGVEFFQSQENYPQLAAGMIYPFVREEISNSTLQNIAESAFSFPVPIVELNKDFSILELFHGPTFAFKDFAARFMSRTMAYFLEQENKELTLLVATSGDTGSAVAHGFFGVEGIHVVILYPSKRVSPFQEKQLTTLGGNITALEVEGSFDDCQQLAKEAFQDVELKSKKLMSSANSINMARLLPQSVYYAWAWKKIKAEGPVVFSVPSGNFGNLTGGLLAKKMGLPIEKFVAATNANDVFPKYLDGGDIQTQSAKHTLSNAMDVGIPSNLERIQELYNRNVIEIQRDIESWSFSDKNTTEMIYNSRRKWNYILDPHTAVGFLGLKKYYNKTKSKAKGVVLSTANPGKFSDIVEPIIGKHLILPQDLKRAIGKEKKSILISNQFEDFKELLLSDQTI